MPSWHDHGVSKDGRLGREEGHDVLVAVDLASIGIVPLDDLAEWAIRIACMHSEPAREGKP